MKRLIVIAGVVALVGAACAGHGAVAQGPVVTEPTTPAGPSTTTGPTTTTTTPPTGPTGTPGTTPPATPSQTPPDTVTYDVWFATPDNHLTLVRRTEPATVAVGRASLEALLGGPTDAEIAAGAGTEIPPGTRLLHLAITGGVARVDLSRDYFSGGSAVSQFLRIGQLVATVSQFRSVHGVAISLEGEPIRTFDIQGTFLGRPWVRGDFELLFPAIMVESPVAGDAISSPVEISGNADVFEATVSLRILDEHGHEIANGVTNATCGSGCRGTFHTTLSYHVDHTQRGTVEVFEASAKDGSPINVVRIPITLEG